MNSKNKFLLFLVFVLVSVLIASLSSYYGLSQSTLESFVSLNHPLVAFIYTTAFIILATFSFSVSVMTSIAVFFFTTPEAITYAMLGILGSSIIDFYIARKLGRDYVRKYIIKRSGGIEKFDKIVEKDTFKTILILSAIFFVPPTIPNLLGGVINIDFKKYVLATMLGNLPNTIFTIYLALGILNSNTTEIYSSIAGITVVSLVSLFFYKGEIKDIFKVSFPWFFRKD